MSKLTRQITLLLLLMLLVACGKGQAEIRPPEIRYGETECVECRMIINDPRFAAAFTYQASKGRYESLPFDDIGDMLIYADKHPEHEIVAYWVHDYYTEEWIDARKAHFVFSQHLQTPMAQGTAAVESREKTEQLTAEYPGQALDWAGLLSKHRAGELVVALVGEAAMGSEAMHSHTHGVMHAHEDETLITLGEADVTGYHLKLLSHGALHAGYNPLMLQLINPAGENVTQADVAFHPLMHMPEMDHAAPVEQPNAQAHVNAHFGGAIGFPMPSGPDLGTWEIGVTFSDPANGVAGQAAFPVEVAPSKWIGSFVATDDEGKLFLMIVSPEAAGVGRQSIEILAAQKQSAMDWPPVDDLTLEIAPEMPTMGHGSPGNENPTFIGDGHYRGKVNFTMAGPWTVTIKASRADMQIGEVVFEFDVR